MSSERVESRLPQPSLLERLSILQIVIGIVLSVAGGAVSVWVTQASTTTRLSAVEEQVKENKTDVLRLLSEIREDVKEVRAEQLRQARESR